MPSRTAEELSVRSEGAIGLPALAERLRLAMIRLGRQLRRHDPSKLSIAQVSRTPDTGLKFMQPLGPG